VQYEIRPEPTPEEREVLARALAAVPAGGGAPDAPGSAWWEAGAREAVDDGGETAPFE
jgi:hypothetical protein